MTVSFNNIPADLRVPLFYAEMDNSAANTASEVLRSLIIGHGLASVTSGKNELQLATTAAAAKGLVGQGSQLAAMVEAYRNVDSFGELWMINVPEPTAGAVATGTITVTGTAQAAGVLSLYIAAQRVQVAVAANDTAAVVAASVLAAVNAAADLPVIATAGAAGVTTLTARWKGLTGNDISLLHSYRGVAGGEDVPKGLTLTIAAMSGGAGSPDLTAAIAAMGDELFDYIGMPWTDSTSVDALEREMNDSTGRWSWSRQIYGHIYTAKKGTVSDLVTFGKARNGQHISYLSLEPLAPAVPYCAAAAFTARNAIFIRIDPARPTQTGDLDGQLPAPMGKRFIASERQTLLSSGMATQTVQSGVMQVERAITNYQRNKYGAADNSYLDSETLHTSAYVIRRLRGIVTSKYGRHKLANDGTRFGPGQAIVTPSVVKGEVMGEYKLMEREGIVENFEVFAQYLIVERDKDSNRMNMLFPPDYVNQLRIFAMLNQFRLQYQEA